MVKNKKSKFSILSTITLIIGLVIGIFISPLLFIKSPAQTLDCPGGCYDSIKSRNFDVLTDYNQVTAYEHGTCDTDGDIEFIDCQDATPLDMCFITYVHPSSGIVKCACWDV